MNIKPTPSQQFVTLRFNYADTACSCVAAASMDAGSVRCRMIWRGESCRSAYSDATKLTKLSCEAMAVVDVLCSGVDAAAFGAEFRGGSLATATVTTASNIMTAPKIVNMFGTLWKSRMSAV